MNARRMDLILRIAVAMCLNAGIATAQDAVARFDVISIRPNTAGDGPRIMNPPQGEHFRATNITVRQLIQRAFGGQQAQGAPGWIDEEGFDVDAVSPVALTPPMLGPMLRDLLKSRFNLAVHSETRPGQIAALVVARSDRPLGPQLKVSSADCPVPPGPQSAAPNPSCGFVMTPGRLVGRGVTAGQIVAITSRLLQRSVADRTGLTGSYDLELVWTPDDPVGGLPGGAVVDANAPALITALQEQLGLKLEMQHGSIDVLMIDRIERPAAN